MSQHAILIQLNPWKPEPYAAGLRYVQNQSIFANGSKDNTQADSWGPVSQVEMPAAIDAIEAATKAQKKQQQQEQPVKQSVEVMMEGEPEWNAEQGASAGSASRAVQAAVQEAAPQPESSRPSGACRRSWKVLVKHCMHSNVVANQQVMHHTLHRYDPASYSSDPPLRSISASLKGEVRYLISLNFHMPSNSVQEMECMQHLNRVPARLTQSHQQ